MARPVVGDKRTDIRNAAVSEVVDCGYANCSINRIATRAQLSVGSIYRYFTSKEHLLQSVYLEIKTDLHQCLMDAAKDCTSSKCRIKSMWFAMLAYARKHPDDFLFSEKVSNEIQLAESESQALEAMTTEILNVIETAIADGTLRDSPPATHILLLSAPAIQLARTAASQGKPVDHGIADDIFSMLWQAVVRS